MPAKIDLSNKIIHNLLVIEETSQRKNKSVVWKCKCLLCGKECYFSTKELRSDGVQQCSECGKSRKPEVKLRENIIGQTFNNLTVDYKTNQKDNSGKFYYSCTCKCGKTNILVVSSDLKTGHTKSCGCQKYKYYKNETINNRLILNIYPDTKVSSAKNRSHYYLCKCLLCNREYITAGTSLSVTSSCGCLNSKGELEIIRLLEANNINYKYQYSVPELPRQRFDFAILDKDNNLFCLLEFDGEQHYESNIKNNGWNTKEHFLYVQQHDLEKDNYAKQHNIPIIRIPYWKRGKLSLEVIFDKTLLDLTKLWKENNNYDQ